MRQMVKREVVIGKDRKLFAQELFQIQGQRDWSNVEGTIGCYLASLVPVPCRPGLESTLVQKSPVELGWAPGFDWGKLPAT